MKSFTVSSWNIQGLRSSALGNKSGDPDFVKELGDSDVFILVETWSKTDTVTHCPTNYREIIVSSQKHSSITRGRESGGLIIWYKSELHNQMSPVKIGINYIWLKLKKKLLLTDMDLFICAIYIPPSESPYYPEDMFPSLETEISHFQAQGNVLICGDTNARTGLLSDLTDPEGDKYMYGGIP